MSSLGSFEGPDVSRIREALLAVAQVAFAGDSLKGMMLFCLR